jgi:dTDP-4-dehydrorhamnose 3,5-epimerase
MQVQHTTLNEVKLITPKAFGDSRGFFFESFQKERYAQLGITVDFVQDNVSRSKYGVLRGLHYQLKFPQAKLVSVIRGAVFDVAVDIRLGSPTFGKWVGAILSDDNHQQLFIPSGFAHGFCVLSDVVDFHYKCSDYYHPDDEHGLLWNDDRIGIVWPKLSVEPILSSKDTQFSKLHEIVIANLPNMLP